MTSDHIIAILILDVIVVFGIIVALVVDRDVV
jgi:hypothetical protein